MILNTVISSSAVNSFNFNYDILNLTPELSSTKISFKNSTFWVNYS